MGGKRSAACKGFGKRRLGRQAGALLNVMETGKTLITRFKAK